MNSVVRPGGKLVMTPDREPLGKIASPSEDCGANGVESSKRAELFKPWAAKRVKMTLNQFSSFAAVAKHLNLTKASAELRVSQPSLSLQLKQLEDHHGTKLYRRLSKGIEITEAGQVLLRKIMPILDQVASWKRVSSRGRPLLHGQCCEPAELLPRVPFCYPSC